MAGQTHCVSCGQPLSRYAVTCRQCGAPQPHKRLGSTAGLALLLLLLAVAVVWIILGDG